MRASQRYRRARWAGTRWRWYVVTDGNGDRRTDGLAAKSGSVEVWLTGEDHALVWLIGGSVEHLPRVKDVEPGDELARTVDLPPGLSRDFPSTARWIEGEIGGPEGAEERFRAMQRLREL